ISDALQALKEIKGIYVELYNEYKKTSAEDLIKSMKIVLESKMNVLDALAELSKRIETIEGTLERICASN
ncbi:MAG: hypothetical protein OQK82_05430, partial [Candidatus Pacearchaeota archaeon]|nr:hypothetical protein [Candidatus Pacearchaeota archaeon]